MRLLERGIDDDDGDVDADFGGGIEERGGDDVGVEGGFLANLPFMRKGVLMHCYARARKRELMRREVRENKELRG